MGDTTSDVKQKEKVSTFFGTSGSWQGGYYGNANDYFSRAIQRRKEYAIDMIKRITLPKGSAVLDIGCGSGVYIDELCRMGYDATGIDLSEEMLAACRKNLLHMGYDAGRFSLRQGDVENIPFPDAVFDLVICIGVFGYLESDETALAEVRRVLKPGGQFLLNLTNAYSLSDIDYIARRKIAAIFSRNAGAAQSMPGPDYAVQSPWMMKHRKYSFKSYNPWKYEDLLGRKGFRKIDAMTYGFEFRVLRRYHILPVQWLDRFELALERFIRRFDIPYLSYSGWVYTGVFEKQ